MHRNITVVYLNKKDEEEMKYYVDGVCQTYYDAYSFEDKYSEFEQNLKTYIYTLW